MANTRHLEPSDAVYLLSIVDREDEIGRIVVVGSLSLWLIVLIRGVLDDRLRTTPHTSLYYHLFFSFLLVQYFYCSMEIAFVTFWWRASCPMYHVVRFCYRICDGY